MEDIKNDLKEKDNNMPRGEGHEGETLCCVKSVPRGGINSFFYTSLC